MDKNIKLATYASRCIENGKKYYAQESEQEDLISIGTIGLIKAISTYRMDKNIKLATYASRCIENAILSQMRLSEKRGKPEPRNRENGVFLRQFLIECMSFSPLWKTM